MENLKQIYVLWRWRCPEFLLAHSGNGSATPSSEKNKVTLPLMPSKMGSLQRRQNSFE